MTIQEAIKSGHPFKRPNHKHWMKVVGDRIEIAAVEGALWTPRIEDIAANDWEVIDRGLHPRECMLDRGALIQMNNKRSFPKPHILTQTGHLVNIETGAVWKYPPLRIPVSKSVLTNYLKNIDYTIIRSRYAS